VEATTNSDDALAPARRARAIGRRIKPPNGTSSKDELDMPLIGRSVQPVQLLPFFRLCGVFAALYANTLVHISASQEAIL
jgi:hypothetical protein